MLQLYVFCLVVGMGLLLASFVHDHDGDADFDADADFDHDVDLDHDVDVGDLDADHDVDVAEGIDAADALWLPLLSLRFWIFFAAFFGLTGTALHFLTTPPWALGVALTMGAGTGYAASWVVRTLRAQKVNSAVDPRVDYVGRRGEVILGVEPGDPGTVRLHAKGIDVDVVAVLADGAPAQRRGDAVLVIRYDEESSTVVVQPYTEPEGEMPERRRERA